MPPTKPPLIWKTRVMMRKRMKMTHCVEKGLNSPADAATWKVWSGKEWEVSPAVKCDYLNAAEVARVTKARDEYWEGAH